MSDETPIHSFYKTNDSARPTVHFDHGGRGKSVTSQEMADDVNINTILKRWKVTGHVAHLAHGEPFYGDFTNADDYLEAKQRLLAANEAFMGLPVHVRNLAENDPAKLIELANDPASGQALADAGLLLMDGAGKPLFEPSKPTAAPTVAAPTPAAQPASTPGGEGSPAEPPTPSGDA